MKCVQWLLLLTAVNDCVDGNDDAARLWSLDAQHHDHPNTNRTRSPKWFEALPTPPCPSDWNESQAQLADDIAMVRRHALLRVVACSSSVRNRTTATPPRAFFNDDSTGQPRGWLALCRRCVSEGFCDDGFSCRIIGVRLCIRLCSARVRSAVWDYHISWSFSFAVTSSAHVWHWQY